MDFVIKRVLTDKVVPPPPSEGENDEQKALQLVKWSPTGNGIAFVADYNIYYRPNAEPNTVARQITKDGSEEQAIYNGVADWVYEGNESNYVLSGEFCTWFGLM